MSDTTEQGEETLRAVKTAFIVIVFENGEINVQTKPGAFNFPLAHEAVQRDVRMICNEITAEMAASAAGQAAATLIAAAKEESKSPLWVAQ